MVVFTRAAPTDRRHVAGKIARKDKGKKGDGGHHKHKAGKVARDNKQMAGAKRKRARTIEEGLFSPADEVESALVSGSASASTALHAPEDNPSSAANGENLSLVAEPATDDEGDHGSLASSRANSRRRLRQMPSASSEPKVDFPVLGEQAVPAVDSASEGEPSAPEGAGFGESVDPTVASGCTRHAAHGAVADGSDESHESEDESMGEEKEEANFSHSSGEDDHGGTCRRRR